MKKPLKLIAMGFVLLTAFSAYADALNSERHLEESRKTAQEFVQKLGGVLKAQFETTGAEQAINVCKEVAPALAQEYSHNNKIVKRVSLKNRNPNLGVADDWEVAVLKEFELKNKPDNSTPQEHYEIIENTDGQWFRYMKAIPTSRKLYYLRTYHDI